MNYNKRIVSFIFFGIAAVIAILGLIQLALYIPSQVEALKEAVQQGATTQQLSDYYRQQFIPQILSYVITALGISGILTACGMIYRKPNNIGISKADRNLALSYKECGNDSFFEDFEIIGKNNQNEGE